MDINIIGNLLGIIIVPNFNVDRGDYIFAAA